MRFLQEHQIVAAFSPRDMSLAANDGDWFDMQLYNRALVVLFKNVGTAGQNPAFTLRQAQDSAGTGAKALNFEEVYSKVGTLNAVPTFTKATPAANNVYTDATSADKESLIAVEVRAAQLDVAGGFRFIQLQIPDVGAAAQIGCGFYIGCDCRYAGEIPPGAQ